MARGDTADFTMRLLSGMWCVRAFFSRNELARPVMGTIFLVNETFFLVLRAVISFLLLVIPRISGSTTFGTSEFLRVAG